MKRIISLILAAMMLVSVFAGMNITAFAEPENGWYQDSEGDWQYYQNGSYVTGWKQIKNVWYYFDEYGWMYFGGVNQIDGKLYYFNKSGAMQTGWIKEVEPSGDYTYWFHAKSSGALDTGWAKISGKWYYFSDWGYMAQGTATVEGKIYAFDKNGAMLSGGWGTNKYGDWFYTKANGECYTGWKKISGKWYYFDEDSGYMYTGPCRVDDKITFFNGSGAWVSKPSNGWNSATATAYNDSGKAYKYTTYCYVQNGNFVTGWKKISNKWYYFSEYSGYMFWGGAYWIENTKTGESTPYYFEKSGAMKTTKGWAQEIYSDGTKGEWYYVNADGTCKTGWLKDGGKYYYLEPHMRTNGTIIDNDKVYLLDANGVWVTATGWAKVKDYWSNGYDWYYVEKGGVCATGWRDINGKTYYFDDDGEMYSNGGYYIDDSYYYFDASGALIEDKIIRT